MAKIKQWKQKNNSSPGLKVSIRKWVVSKMSGDLFVLDVYGGYGLMHSLLWKHVSKTYRSSIGDAMLFLENEGTLQENVFDIDPYASPYEALFFVLEKAVCNEIAVVCTDGSLRRQCFMRSKIPLFIQKHTGWPRRDLSLMASIWYQYPAYLRFLINKLGVDRWEIKHLAVEYSKGTPRNQQTCYFAALLKRK